MFQNGANWTEIIRSRPPLFAGARFQNMANQAANWTEKIRKHFYSFVIQKLFQCRQAGASAGFAGKNMDF